MKKTAKEFDLSSSFHVSLFFSPYYSLWRTQGEKNTHRNLEIETTDLRTIMIFERCSLYSEHFISSHLLDVKHSIYLCIGCGIHNSVHNNNNKKSSWSAIIQNNAIHHKHKIITPTCKSIPIELPNRNWNGNNNRTIEHKSADTCFGSQRIRNGLVNIRYICNTWISIISNHQPTTGRIETLQQIYSTV